MASAAPLSVVIAMDTEGPIDDPRKPDILSTWERVHALVERLCSDDLRRLAPDSQGGPAVFSWFMLTLTGFKTNPFRRPMRHHEVFDAYRERHGAVFERFGDGVYWHYHHPAPSGIGNEWCRDWRHTQEYDRILARLLLERDFFPGCYRAGGRIEDDDVSHWLEALIPFDFSSCAGRVNWDQRESDGQRLGDVCDWSRAPEAWAGYHPDADDYQRPGAMRRRLYRCPDLASGVHTLADDDVAAAFERAAQGAPSVLAFFEHDRRDVTFDRIAHALERIAAIAGEFPDVPWRYANARDAACAEAGGRDVPAPRLSLEPRPDRSVLVRSADPIFGPAPFLALGQADPEAEARRAGLVAVGRGCWLSDPVPADFVRVAAAANSPSGRAGRAHLGLA